MKARCRERNKDKLTTEAQRPQRLKKYIFLKINCFLLLFLSSNKS